MKHQTPDLVQMTEVRKECRAIMHHMYCECGGEFKPENICLTTCPPQYPHMCDKCGLTKIFFRTYPYVDFEELQEV